MIGNRARTSRSTTSVVVSVGLVSHTIARKGRSVRSAPKRSRKLRGFGMDRGSLIEPSADGLCHSRHFDGGGAPFGHRLLASPRIAPRPGRDLGQLVVAFLRQGT